MREAEDHSDEKGTPWLTALGWCPRCATAINDPLGGEVGHWEGMPGGPLYRLACPECDTVLLAFASGEEADADIPWIAVEEWPGTNGS
jgi:hypothetical protein